MSATVEWDIPFVLSTPAGNLPLNGQDSTTGGFYLLDQSKCSSSRDMRVVRDDIPQESGEILHPHFTAGYVANLYVELWETEGSEGKPACGALLVDMWDRLMLHLNSILGDMPLLDANGRLYWTPTGHADRMLNNIRILALPIPTRDEQGFVSATFSVLSEFPYVWDAAETNTDITSGATVDNAGSADFYPVMKVHGPTNDFTITNESIVDQNGDPLELVYNASLPGASSIASGHYVELVFFRNTAYLDGNQDNLKKGIDVASSDFFPLVPGDNVLTVSGYTGALIEMLWQNAYA
jgi:hypothetical protein